MQIALSGRDPRVAHRGLDGRQVDAARYEEGAVRMPQVVEPERRQAGGVPRPLDAAAQRGAVEATAEAVAEDVVVGAREVAALVDGLQTSDLHQAWGALFKHVTLRGKIGRLMVSPLISSRHRNTPEQAAFDEQREACTS